MNQKLPALSPAAMLGLIALWVLAPAGLRPLMLPDEGRYVGVAYAMLQGDALVPTLHGVPFFDKPPLKYWIELAAFHLFGLNDWSARLAPALGAWLMGLALALHLASRVQPRRVVFALLVLATTPGFVLAGQYANLTMEILHAEFPGHAILSEETSAATRSDGWLWVIDPLDGTKNFSRAIPHFGYNIALCFESRPVLGITSHPLLGDTYLAIEGEGCFHNGRRIRVSEVTTLADAVVALDMGYDAPRGGRQLELAAHLWPGMQSLRITGSAALGFAYVAAAKWDIYVHSDLQPWDIAPGLILVREAGGEVLDSTGAPASLFSREASTLTNADASI